MDHLGCGVSAEETDTAGLVIDGPDQILHRRGCRVFEIPPVSPVLAEEAIEIAGTVKDRQILVSMFRSWGIGKFGISRIAAPRANPCSAAIGREGVVIPVDDPLETARGDRDQLSILVFVQSAEALFTMGNAALIEADRTGSPFRAVRRLRGKAIPYPVASMDLPDIVFDFIKVGPDAVNAVSDDLGYEGGILLTMATLHCLSFYSDGGFVTKLHT